MSEYLLSVYHHGDEPERDDDQISRIVDQVESFNADLESSGSLVFAGGLLEPEDSVVIDQPRDTMWRGTFPSNGYLGGMWVIRADNDQDALELGRRASIACEQAIEVRGFQAM